MTEYHKIPTCWKRDPENKNKTLLEGQWATPEIGYLADNAWEWTEKIDGTNIRVWRDGDRVRYHGKTDNASIPAILIEQLQRLFDNNAALRELDTECVLYGEGYGAKIQKGGGNYIPDNCSFILFDVKIGPWWLKREDVEDVAKKLGVKCVPVVGIGTLNEAIDHVRFEHNISETATVEKHQAEGLVMRPMTELFARNGDRIITKIKRKDFAR